MYHSIFDGLSVVSLEGTGLTVQQLLDSSLLQNAITIEDHSVTSTDSSVEPLNLNHTSISVIDEGLTFDEDDVFQCGKCKAQFSSLRLFMLHKRSHCSVVKVKKDATAESSRVHGKSDPLTAECDSRTTLSQQVTSSISSQEVVKGDSNEEQNARYECSISSSSTSGTQSVVVNDGEFFDLALDGSQVFKLNENLHLSTSDDAGNKMIGNKNGQELFAATASLVPEVDSQMARSAIVTEVIAETLSEESASAVKTKERKKEMEGELLGDSVPIVTEIQQTTVFEDLQSGDDADKSSSSRLRSNYHHVFFHGRMAKSSCSSKGEDSQKMRMKHHCSFCSKAFSKNFDLQQHIRSHTGEKPFQCVVCGRAFAQKSNVKKHMITHRVWPQDWVSNTLPKDPIKKILPEEAAESSSEKDVTKEEVLVDDSYVCPFCSIVHANYLELRSHMKHHNDQKVYRCIQKKCEKTFMELDAFLEHIRIHEKELQYRCHTCSKVFNSLHSLGCHQFEHSIYPWPKKSGPSYFRCTKCMNKYASAEALDHHLKMSRHHFPCKQCSRVFFSERLLRSHLRVHGNVNLFTCATCCKVFKTEHSLKMHQLIHTGERPFECQICTLTFNRKDKLKRHLLVHEAKKYKCPYSSTLGCNREFRRNDKLRLHLVSHAHSNLKKHKSSRQPPKTTNQQPGRFKEFKADAKEMEVFEEKLLVSENEAMGRQPQCKKSTTTYPAIDRSRSGLRSLRRSYAKCGTPSHCPDIRESKTGKDEHRELSAAVDTKIKVRKHSVPLIKKESGNKPVRTRVHFLESMTGVSPVEPDTSTVPSASSLNVAPSIVACGRDDQERPSSTRPQQQLEEEEEEEDEEEEEFIVSYPADEENAEKLKSEHDMEIIYIPFSLTQDEFLEAKEVQQGESEPDNLVLSPSAASIVTCASDSSAVVATSEHRLETAPPQSVESNILIQTPPTLSPRPPSSTEGVVRLSDTSPPFFVSGDEAVSFVTASSIQNLDNLSAEMLLAPSNLQAITAHADNGSKPSHHSLSDSCRISITSISSASATSATTSSGSNAALIDGNNVNSNFFVVKETRSAHSSDYPNYSFRRKGEKVGITLGNGGTIILDNKDDGEFCIQSEFIDDANT